MATIGTLKGMGVNRRSTVVRATVTCLPSRNKGRSNVREQRGTKSCYCAGQSQFGGPTDGIRSWCLAPLYHWVIIRVWYSSSTQWG